MKKLFFSLIILSSLNSLQAMDSTSRVLIGGSAVVCGLAGNVGAHVLVTRAARHLQDASTGEFTTDFGSYYSYSKAQKNYIRKAAIGGALRTGSCISALLLGRYAYNNVLPANNAQTYASLVAIAAAGSVAEIGNACAVINWHETCVNKAPIKYLLGASALAGLGIYGLYTNK